MAPRRQLESPLAKYTRPDRDRTLRGQLPAACSSLTCTIRDGCYRT